MILDFRKTDEVKTDRKKYHTSLYIERKGIRKKMSWTGGEEHARQSDCTFCLLLYLFVNLAFLHFYMIVP